ncbi:MAG TPA: methyltransferase domain-containing protein [Mycobacteriales bacterium]|nr:methyltransferase domain-containing protein [Mycobacteriales bacterium]
MEFSESRRTSWSTDEAAAVYERGRPDYAEAAVDWALEPVRDRPGLRALDLGAGTGKLTRQLIGRGVATVALDLSAGMLAELARAVPAATTLLGRAEQVPLPDASIDLAVAGQAFHWFDRCRTLPELARVLRPGGVFAVLYNARDDQVSWVRALSEVIEETGDHASVALSQEPWDLGPMFGPAEVFRAEHDQPLDVAGLLDLVGSRSYVIRMDPAERDALLGRVAELARTHPALVGRQYFSMPYVTTCQRYTLRS